MTGCFYPLAYGILIEWPRTVIGNFPGLQNFTYFISFALHFTSFSVQNKLKLALFIAWVNVLRPVDVTQLVRRKRTLTKTGSHARTMGNSPSLIIKCLISKRMRKPQWFWVCQTTEITLQHVPQIDTDSYSTNVSVRLLEICLLNGHMIEMQMPRTLPHLFKRSVIHSNAYFSCIGWYVCEYIIRMNRIFHTQTSLMHIWSDCQNSADMVEYEICLPFDS